MNRVARVLLTLCAVAMPATAVQADGHLEKSIEARQGYMKVLGHNMGPLGAMAKGKAPYDADTAKAHAMNLDLAARMNTGSLWPKGSDATAMPDVTRAKLEAWSTYPKVAEAHKDFAAAAANLAAVAGNGEDAFKEAFMAVGKSCGGCHKPFRVSKD